MPYFSFSLKQNFFKKDRVIFNNFQKIELNKVYYSKNTTLWKNLNKKKNLAFLNYHKFEERKKIKFLGNKILFCLPPSIGLGDAVEYGLAFKSIIDSNKFKSVGIAFTGRYKVIFKNYFDCKKIYADVILETDLIKYDTIYHLSLEISALQNQKYIRSDIEDNITKKFKVLKNRNVNIVKSNIIKKITLFPISQSPIRSMPVNLINDIVNSFVGTYEIDIVFDSTSEISNYIERKMNCYGYKGLYPKSLNNVCKIVEKIDFGIFIDSGPLHLAKIMKKRGALISTTVSGKILLNNFFTIKEIKNVFNSKFCKSPCGLTNIFNYENNVGCYQSLSIFKEVLLKKKFNSLQRGSIKKEYVNFMINPVGCIKNINSYDLIQAVKRIINN